MAQFGILCWGGPMTLWAIGGGFSGLLTLPICLLATLWDIQHWDIIVLTLVSTWGLDRLGLPAYVTRILILLANALYLTYRGRFVFNQSGESFVLSLVSSIYKGSRRMRLDYRDQNGMGSKFIIDKF